MIHLVDFAETSEMQRRAAPVLMEYAAELKAADVLKAVQNVK
jgi:hypothetical protein